MNDEQLQFLSNEKGDVTGVVVPIEHWREIASELETRHLLSSNTMRERLRAARARNCGTGIEEVVVQYGLQDTGT